jgi:GTP pyrophosphokinase
MPAGSACGSSWEMEDLSFRILEPDVYRQVARLLDEKRTDREHYIEV